MDNITFFGVTNYRNIRRKFGIKLDDRRRHFYAIGKTGVGKTEMLKNMALQDIERGHGMGFIDPHGEAVEELLLHIPKERIKDVIYVNPADISYPIAFNVMENVAPENRHLIASGLMSVFKKIWPDVWSARMEYILNNTILALLEYPGATLLGVNRMLSDPDYRKMVVEKVTDPVVKSFWVQEYGRYTQRYEVEATAAIQNKVGQFVSNPLIRNIVGQNKSTIDMREVMDGQKILLVNISKGRIGEDNSRLLGGLLVTKMQLAAMSRVDIPEEERKDFFLYIDEFQNFATESFANILSEARKYRLSLILSHQYIKQLDETVADAVFGNVGTLVSFRIGADDAEAFEKEFFPEFMAPDFVNLAKYSIYVKLMIDGITSRPFSASTLPPLVLPETSYTEEIIDFSRKTYGTPVEEVEDEIIRWTGMEELARIADLPPTAEAGVLYDAICDRCKKETKVVFPPDGKRPVYCKKCRKKIQNEREAAKNGREQKPAEKSENVPQQPQAARQEPQKSQQQKPSQEQQSRSEGQHQKNSAPSSVSLRDLLNKAKQSEHTQPAPRAPEKKSEPKQQQKPEQKNGEYPKEELRKALKDALSSVSSGKNTQREAEDYQSGVIQPGETVYFNNEKKQ